MSDGQANLMLEHLRLMREEMAAFRREQNDMRTVVLSAVDRVRRLERRLEEVRDDLELTIKSELMGRLGHFETEMEKRLDSLRREQTDPFAS